MMLYDKKHEKGTYNLQQVTYYLQYQKLEDDIQMEKLKYLPAVSINGVWKDGIVEYSNYTAIDFDHIETQESFRSLYYFLLTNPHVAYVFVSPSGKGLKAIVRHDNDNPALHEDLYTQLLKFFDNPYCPPDPNNIDLSRRLYLCYDPYVWSNPLTIPYHYIPSVTPFKVAVKNKYTQHKVGIKREGNNTCGISDRSIMCMLKAQCKKRYNHFLKEGDRRNGAYWFGKMMAKAGVDYETGLDFTIEIYESDEIELTKGNPFTVQETVENFKNGYESEDYSEDYRKSFISKI